MEHVCTDILFLFWDGKTQYTINYCPSLRAWFVFEGEKQSEALAKFALSKKQVCTASKGSAEDCLREFLNPGTTCFQEYLRTNYDYSKQNA